MIGDYLLHSGFSRSWSGDSRNHQYSGAGEGPGQGDSSGRGKWNHWKLVLILQMLMFKCFSYSFCVLMILKNNLFFRISFSKTLAALVLSFLVRHSPKLPSPPLRIQDGPLEKRKGPSPRRWQGVLGPQEPKRRVKRDYLKQKQENSIWLRSTPNIHSRNFNLESRNTRTRYDVCRCLWW